MVLARVRLGFAVAFAVTAVLMPAAAADAATYNLPPTGQDQWYWEIGPSAPGVSGLPPTTGAYPAPGSANIWDTDLFQDSNAPNGGIPTGPSPVVQALHASGKYSICYIEAGAYQTRFPDDADFAAADYGGGAGQYGLQGFPGEWWLDISGFANYVAGDSSTLTGAAVDIAAGLDKRIGWCALEGHDAVEPDDTDAYTNSSASGVAGGGWQLTQADSAGFERWLANDAHLHGLAIFQKNDPANAAAQQPLFDGMIVEQCNAQNGPCGGPLGEAAPYLASGKPVLNAEYTQDGQTTANFCSTDTAAGVIGALFDASLNGTTYQACAPVGTTRPGGTGSGGTGAAGPGATGDPGSGGTGGTVQPPGTGNPSAAKRPPRGPTGKPVKTKRPSLTGTARRGHRLRVSRGSWSGAPTSYSYAWKRCASSCAPVKHATGNSYLLGARDIGYRFVATVTAHNARGSTRATSTRSPVVNGRVTRRRAA